MTWNCWEELGEPQEMQIYAKRMIRVGHREGLCVARRAWRQR